MSTDPLANAHIGGRVTPSGDGVVYSWPGVYFEGAFTGTGIGVAFDDGSDFFDVEIDGAPWGRIAMPGKTTHVIEGLPGGRHTIRVGKRNETESARPHFGGFVAQGGGTVLAPPRARGRQIEFIGDSFTAGYGNESTSRDCDPEQIARTSNANVSFGALAARHLDADYQLNAYSGLGMVRNWNGRFPETNFRTYYDRAVVAEAGDTWVNPGTWKPPIVVIGLGVNDFSTEIQDGEAWTPGSLRAAYKSAYHGFLHRLRGQYGPGTTLVVSATYLANTTAFATAAQEIVAEENAAGDASVRYWYYDGLDYGGCQSHPSAADHRLIAAKLIAFIDTLGLAW
jgi:hypothetical protein